MSKKPKGPFKLDAQHINSLLQTKPTESLQKQMASEQYSNFVEMPVDELIGKAAETKDLPLTPDISDLREAEKEIIDQIDEEI